MIQVSRTNPPVVPVGGEGDALASASMTNADVAAQVPPGDPLARFGAMHGFHPRAEQFGHASPDGSGGSRAETAPRADEARAAMDRARAHLGGREPTATGIEESKRLFDTAIVAIQEGRHADALQAFEQAYELNPLDDLRYDQAAVLEKMGLRHVAIARYQQYLSEAPKGTGADDAARRIEALRAQPDGPVTAGGRPAAQEWMARGIEALMAHRYDVAIAAFHEGFRAWPDSAFILNEAAALRDSGRFAEADLAYQRYLADPNAPRADEAREAQQLTRARMGGHEATITGVAESKRLFADGIKEYRAGHYEAALDAFEGAHALNPLAELRYNQAACLDKLGLRSAALASYRSYLAEASELHDAKQVHKRMDTLRAEAEREPITASGRLGGREWMARGLDLLRDHRYDEAVKAFQEGFRTYPDRAFILDEAAALLDGGHYAEADLAYQRYLSDPDAPRADEARDAQQRARAHLGGRAAQITDDAEARRFFDAGQAAFQAGRFGDALQAFDSAYERKPLPELRYNQAACLDKLGLRELAAQRYDAYLKEKPDAADAGKVHQRIATLREQAREAAHGAFDRGQDAFAKGNFREAAAAFAQAYEQLPLPEFLFNQAMALAQGGDRARAVHYFQLYLDMNPGAADADKVRARIDLLQQASGAGLMKPGA